LFSQGGAKASDSCSKVTWSNDFKALSDGCGNTGTAKVEFTVTDDAGNSSSTTATFAIQDTTDPVIVVPLTRLTINCPETPVFGEAAPSDGCGNIKSFTFADETIKGSCSGSYSVKRTWTAIDECDNKSEAYQTITVKDVDSPVFNSLPAPQDIAFNDVISFEQAVVTDCSSYQLTYIDDKTTPNCDGSYSITRIWTANDGCNDISNASQIINVKSSVIDAKDDLGLTVNGLEGGISLTNVLANDVIDGVLITNSNLVTTTFVSSTNAGITLSGTQVIVSPNTPGGNHTLTYKITSVATCTFDTATVTLFVDSPAIEITKEGTYDDTDKNGATNVGDTIKYTFVVSNTGNVPLINVTVTDPLVTVLGGPITLAVGASNSTTFTATYSITQTDIDAGAVYNLATATGTPPIGDPVKETSTDPNPCTGVSCAPVIPSCLDCTITNLPQNPAIEVIKTANVTNYATVGEEIVYTIKVKNTGNVILYNIRVTDPLTNFDTTILELQPDDFKEFTQKYVTTQIDVESPDDEVINVAYAKGYTLSGTSVDDSDEVTIERQFVLACDALVVHNAFSPNGDEKNPVFIIDNITDECYIDNTVEIYNRWGVLVFETKNYDNETNVFDGTSRGRTTIKQSEGLPTGTYFYIINYTSSTTDGIQTFKKDGYLYLTK
jgi:gliding motility-associated-like protein/uncharacterized repeat protein (TIGR01451 family)